jgi:hypothetical protein
MRATSRIAFVAALLGTATPLLAQGFPGFPGTHLKVDINVASISHGGDSVRITYVVRNLPVSEERFLALTIEAPVRATNLSLPQPRRSWVVASNYGERNVASWAALDDSMVTPGRSSQPLAFTAHGLPGIVDAHVEGQHEIPHIEELADDDPRLTGDALEVGTVPMRTVGVVAPLANPTRAALIARLVGLAQQTCTLRWTTDAHICSALGAHLRAPLPRMSGVLEMVEAARERPRGMNDNAYWLLRSNAEIVRDFVDVAGIRLTYVCGNTFRIRNLNYVPVTVRYEVAGTTEAGTLTLTGLSSDDGPAHTPLTTTAMGTVRLLYRGRVIQTVANRGGVCES